MTHGHPERLAGVFSLPLETVKRIAGVANFGVAHLQFVPQPRFVHSGDSCSVALKVAKLDRALGG
jgi:hypothetical protein